LDELVGNHVVVALGDSFEMLVHLISTRTRRIDDDERDLKSRTLRTRGESAYWWGLVFRMCFDCALSCFDSYALERRLWSRLLLRHPQVSNQNSKRAGDWGSGPERQMSRQDCDKMRDLIKKDH
jgi:hypothetical protein